MDEILKIPFKTVSWLNEFEKRKHGFRENRGYYVIGIVANFIFLEKSLTDIVFAQIVR